MKKVGSDIVSVGVWIEVCLGEEIEGGVEVVEGEWRCGVGIEAGEVRVRVNECFVLVHSLVLV